MPVVPLIILRVGERSTFRVGKKLPRIEFDLKKKFPIRVISFWGVLYYRVGCIAFNSNFYYVRYTRWSSVLFAARRRKMADYLGYTTGDCKRGLYVNTA